MQGLHWTITRALTYPSASGVRFRPEPRQRSPVTSMSECVGLGDWTAEIETPPRRILWRGGRGVVEVTGGPEMETHQCDYYTRLLNVFESAEFGNHLPPGIRQSWREICQQPPAYPPPDSHPLSRSYKGP